MADDVAITAGSGTTIATDDAAGRHVQLFKLAIATDGSATLIPATAAEGLLITEARPATATLANVASSATNVTLRASAATRKGLMIFNESATLLYVKLGTTASVTSYTVRVAPGGYYELPTPIYTGNVDGIWSSADGNARVTEIT